MRMASDNLSWVGVGMVVTIWRIVLRPLPMLHYYPKKFGIGISCCWDTFGIGSIRTDVPPEQGLDLLSKPQGYDAELSLKWLKKRLGLSDAGI